MTEYAIYEYDSKHAAAVATSRAEAKRKVTSMMTGRPQMRRSDFSIRVRRIGFREPSAEVAS